MTTITTTIRVPIPLRDKLNVIRFKYNLTNADILEPSISSFGELADYLSLNPESKNRLLCCLNDKEYELFKAFGEYLIKQGLTKDNSKMNLTKFILMRAIMNSMEHIIDQEDGN